MWESKLRGPYRQCLYSKSSFLHLDCYLHKPSFHSNKPAENKQIWAQAANINHHRSGHIVIWTSHAPVYLQFPGLQSQLVVLISSECTFTTNWTLSFLGEIPSTDDYRIWRDKVWGATGKHFPHIMYLKNYHCSLADRRTWHQVRLFWLSRGLFPKCQNSRTHTPWKLLTKHKLMLFRSQYKILDYKASSKGWLLLMGFKAKLGRPRQESPEHISTLLLLLYKGSFAHFIVICKCLTIKLQLWQGFNSLFFPLAALGFLLSWL